MTLKNLLKKIRSNEKHHKKLYFVAMVVLSIILFFPVFFQIRHQEFRSLGLVGVFFLNLLGSATIFLPAPGFLAVGISATQINPLIVAAIGALGAAIGEGTTFLFGYTSTKLFNLERHRWLKKFKKIVFDTWGGVAILLFAFIPNPFFDGIGILAGIAHYPIKRFIILTFIGRLLRYIVIGYVSSSIAFR